MIQPMTTGSFAQEINDFIEGCALKLEHNILIEGLLPPIVRGQRLAQNQQDNRPHMGGSGAENGSHFAAYLALKRQLALKHNPQLTTQVLDQKVLSSIRPFLGKALVPFAHQAVLQSFMSYGPLSQNALWKLLDEKTQLACLEHNFTVDSYFDLKNRKMRALPNNYLWITCTNAQLIAELLTNSNAHYSYANSASWARQAASVAFAELIVKLGESPWFDDSPPHKIVDQYAWETLAAAMQLSCYFADKQQTELLLDLATQYRDLLYKLIRDDGYAICWGRSQGIISYGTSLFSLLSYGKALYAAGRITREAFGHDIAHMRQAFLTLKNHWFDSDGLTTMHKLGRETFSYRRSHRLVGSTFGILVKLMHWSNELDKLDEQLSTPAAIKLPECVHHYQVFDESKDRSYGLWVAKNDHWHIALPVVGNPKKFDPKVSSSYLPAAIMPFVIDVPTQHSAPYGTEFIEMRDGTVYAAADGCDHVIKSETGLCLYWKRFLNIETLEYIADLGTLEINYHLEHETLRIQHIFMTSREDIYLRYSLLGIALSQAQKLSQHNIVFTGSTQRLVLTATGEITQVNLENVSDLPAGKSFLCALPWAVSCFLPNKSSQFGLELSLYEL